MLLFIDFEGVKVSLPKQVKVIVWLFAIMTKCHVASGFEDFHGVSVNKHFDKYHAN
jgi:hypothetical protein